MSSLFHKPSPEENPSELTNVAPRRALHPLIQSLSPVIQSHGPLIGLAIALALVLGYGVHERSVAASSSAKSAQATLELKTTRAQLIALNEKLDAMAKSQQVEGAVAVPELPSTTVVVAKPDARRSPVVATHSTGQRRKPDPRWRQVQSQLDAQGKQIDEQGKQIESARQEIVSTRTDLEGSIAKTHDEVVVLQKKGERNYFEFDLEKSKNFHTTGPVGISLRKANTKQQYADLKLLVDDRELAKKHLDLYEPVVFYPSEERQPVELVINSITKNHVRGYISSPKYKASELANGTPPNDRQKLVPEPR